MLSLRQNKYGPLRTFSSEDLVNTLLLLQNTTIPRGALSKKLELGEGATRTIIAELARQGLLETKKKGCMLTKKGGLEARKLRRHIASITQAPATPLTYSQAASLLLLKNAKIRHGLEERDAAIKAGASGATILTVKAGKLFFPDSLSQVDPVTAEKITPKNAEDGDVIILAYGPKKTKAAIAAAMQAMGEKR